MCAVCNETLFSKATHKNWSHFFGFNAMYFCCDSKKNGPTFGQIRKIAKLKYYNS